MLAHDGDAVCRSGGKNPQPSGLATGWARALPPAHQALGAGFTAQPISASPMPSNGWRVWPLARPAFRCVPRRRFICARPTPSFPAAKCRGRCDNPAVRSRPKTTSRTPWPRCMRGSFRRSLVCLPLGPPCSPRQRPFRLSSAGWFCRCCVRRAMRPRSSPWQCRRRAGAGDWARRIASSPPPVTPRVWACTSLFLEVGTENPRRAGALCQSFPALQRPGQRKAYYAAGAGIGTDAPDPEDPPAAFAAPAIFA